MSSSPPSFFLSLKKECSLTRRERDPNTAVSCTTAPSTRYSRGSASTVTYAESSPASPPWPTNPGRKAYPDLKNQGTNRLAAAEHQLLQSVVHAAADAVRQPSGVCLSPRCEAWLSLSLRGCGRLPSLFQRRRPITVCVLYSLALSISPADCRLPSLLRR